MPQIYFQLHHPLQKKHIYNNLKPSPLDRQYKKSTPCKHINFTLLIYFQPSLPQKNPQHFPPKKKCQRHGSSSSLTYSSRYTHDFQGSSLTFSLAGQSGQPKSGLAGPQLVWLARDTFIGFGQPIIITIY